MNKEFIYIYKFMYKTPRGKYNLTSFFPLLSIVLGCLVILLVLGTMESMENTIFKAIEVANFKYKGKVVEKLNNEFYYEDVYPGELNPYIGDIKQYIITNNDKQVAIKITLLDQFSRFKNEHIKDYLIKKDLLKYGPEIIIGESLADKLNLNLSDSVKIISPLDIDIASSYIPTFSVRISGIFSYGGELPLDYENSDAFMASEYFELIQCDSVHCKEKHERLIRSTESKNNLFFLSPNDNYNISEKDIDEYNLEHWSENHSQLAAALKIEKLLYSSFGYFVILIAALSSGALTSLFIIKKTKQLAVLRVLGCSDILIISAFTVNSIIISILGVFIGIIFYFIISVFDSKYYWIKNTFFMNFPEFSINFNMDHCVFIFLCSLLFMIVSTLYPVLKIKKLDLAGSLNNKL